MKKKRFVTWIVLFMSVSLISIIIIHTFQLTNSYKKSKESIDRGVSKAIANTLLTLQKQDAVLFVYDKMTGNGQSVYDSIFPVDPFMLQSATNTGIESFSLDGYHVHLQTFPGLNLSQLGYSFLSDCSNSNNMLEIEKYMFEDFHNKRVQIQNIISQLETEFKQRQVPIEDRFDVETISCLLRRSLLAQGLNLNFEFAIVDENNKLKINSDNFDPNKLDDAYSFNLIPGSIFSNPDIFKIYFPRMKKFALQAIYAQLGTSILLTLLFIFTFGVSLYALLRQKKLSEVKSDFINNMTHEFKTPIATIKLAASSIKNSIETDNPKTLEKMIDIISQETSRMNQHVEQVLQMAVIEKKTIKLKKTKEIIDDIINDSIQNFELVIKERNGTITSDFNANIKINVDRDLLENVFNNIIDNAIKYSENNPEILVKSLVKSKKIVISFKDNGIGMTKDVQNKVFERFYRAPTGNVHNIKGFGLGLNYAKEIVSSHKGIIKVKSSPGKGSTFTIELPYNT